MSRNHPRITLQVSRLPGHSPAPGQVHSHENISIAPEYKQCDILLNKTHSFAIYVQRFVGTRATLAFIFNKVAPLARSMPRGQGRDAKLVAAGQPLE